MCIACEGKVRLPKAGQPVSRRTFLQSSAAMGAVYAAASVTGARPLLAKAAPKATFIIENAKIITLDPKNPHAEAIAIAGETILAAGTRRDIAG